jgi:hypothetical protein
MDSSTARVAFSLVASVTVACASSSSGGLTSMSSASDVIPSCSVPTVANTLDDASGTGCNAQTIFQICEVPNGSTIEPDGDIVTPSGTHASCMDLCSDAEYSLVCSGSASADTGLGCRVLPLPTPNGVTEYCCPCGQ